MKAVFLDQQVFGENVPYHLLEDLPVDWTFYAMTSPDTVLTRIRDAEIVCSNKVVLDQDLLTAAPFLKLICISATGYNNVDLIAAKNLGICVSNVPDYSTFSVAQMTMSLMLALFTHLVPYVNATQNGAWQQSKNFCRIDYPIYELQNKTIGIIGAGSIGKAVAKMASAFGMNVFFAKHTVKKASSTDNTVPLDVLLSQADVVSVHLPLNRATRGLIGAKEIAMMKQSAFLLNLARGGIVDEYALCNALIHKIIAGAALDVLTEEPPRAGNPLLQISLPNLLVTPHISWASYESRYRLIEVLRENIASFLKGEPKNLID